MLRLFIMLRTLRPAVFHANLHWTLAARSGLVAAVLARIPAIIATLHVWVPISHPRTIALQRLLYHGVGKYVTVSHDLSQHCLNVFRFPARKIQVIHNGIDIPHFDRPASPDLRRVLTDGRNCHVVLIPARLDAQKGHRYLLEAATQIPNAIFVLAGDGPARLMLEAQVQSLHLSERVVFLGHRDDMPDLMASCDLVVLPSLFEGFPLVLLEAMAARKPIVATAVGGVQEALTHGQTGLLVPPADGPALARAIQTLLAEPALAQKLVEQAHTHVTQHFSAEVMVQQITRVYDELLLQSNRTNETL